RAAVDENRLAENLRIAGEIPRPRAMAEHDHRRSTALVVCRRERAAAFGADTEDVEEVARDEWPFHPAALDPGINLWGPGERLGEHAGLANERFVLGPGEELWFRVGRPLPLDREQLMRVANVVGPEDP